MALSWNQFKGYIGEYIALIILLSKGFWPIKHRHRIQSIEIDWIMRKANHLIAVEVKYRGHLNRTAYPPLHRTQYQRLMLGLMQFQRSTHFKHFHPRIDLMIISFQPNSRFSNSVSLRFPHIIHLQSIQPYDLLD